MPDLDALFAPLRAPTALPDGGHWTARFTDWEPYRTFDVGFAVTIVAADGTTTTFEVRLPEPDAWSEEPARAAADLDFQVKLRLGWLDRG